MRHSPQHMVRYCAANQQAVGKIRPTDGRTARFAQRTVRMVCCSRPLSPSACRIALIRMDRAVSPTNRPTHAESNNSILATTRW